MAVKNFKAALQNDRSFDGMDISQTYEEHEATKKGDIKALNEPKKRMSLYLPESLYNRVSMLASVSRTNMNQLIITLLEKNITDDKIQQELQNLQKAMVKT